MKTKIAIVEDNSFLLRAVEEKLGFFKDIVIKWKAVNGKDCLEKIDEDHLIDLVLMDIEMPFLNGVEATEQIKKKYPQIKIVILTVFDNDENIFNAIKAGADGYLLKDVDPESLYKGIKDTLNGGAAMTPSIALRTLKLLRNPIDLKSIAEQEQVSLTNREAEVLEQLSNGLSYTKIADNLFLSPSTVRKHIENIYAKLQVHSKLEAIQKAKRINLI
jgi:DNA-binding NarL/FixJ family response regulator